MIKCPLNQKLLQKCFTTFSALIFFAIISDDKVISAPTHDVNFNESDIMIEDDKAFWDAKPYNQSGLLIGGSFGIHEPQNKTNPLNRIPGNCSISPLEFDCGNGICIPIKLWRDCHNDCPGGVDEECWVNQLRCDGCKCVDSADEKTLCRKN